ncbi:MAG TPA: ATP-dependent DNA helicase [Nitrospiria bacterium]|nr:ATP-dependent DNA helicase [Nitrospiria bacterium]
MEQTLQLPFESDQALNDAQQVAVQFGEGPLLIIAGAGTGKTLVLTRRIAHLITSKRARPEEILALTFTERAAQEMEERVDQLVPYGYTDVWMSTFHAFGDRLLRDHALLLGIPSSFQVLTRPEQLLFLREHLFELPLERFRPLGNPTRHLQALLTAMSRAKDEDVSPDDYVRYAEQGMSDASNDSDPARGEFRRDEAAQQLEVARCYARYQELLGAAGLIDFGDQVTLTLKLLREHPAVLARYQERFRYILVDEFQDTNYAQYLLVKLLGGQRRNLTVVGDDDQSIYRFRGAAMSNILMFGRDYPDAKRVVLSDNYRSTQPILDSAYRLVRHNDPERLEVHEGINKRLLASRHAPSAPPVRHLHFDTLSAEADGVARWIKEAHDGGARAYRDIAILVRGNDHADPYLKALNLAGVPWRFSGSRGLYDQDEVRLLIEFLRVLVDPHHFLHLHYLARSPIYGMPMEDLTECTWLCHRLRVSLYTIFRRLNEGTATRELSPDGRAAIARLVSDLKDFQELARRQSAGAVLYEFFKRSGWLQRLNESRTGRAAAEMQNIALFFDVIRRFETLHADHPTVQAFVDRLDLLIEAGDDPSTAQADVDADAVTVTTIHKAKGLEFPVVFLVSLVEQRFPSRDRSEAIELPPGLIKDLLPEGDIHLQEERRLFYVGMTRARDELFLTSARDFGTDRIRKVSRFVVEALELNPKTISPVKSSPLESIERHAPPQAVPAPATDLLGQPLEASAPLQLSYYKIDDYLTCPLKYKFNHILRWSKLLYQHHTVIYGAALHQAITAYLNAKLDGKRPVLDDLYREFEAMWKSGGSAGFIDRAHEERRFAAGKAALARFYEREEAAGALPTSVERSFRIPVGPNMVTGRWDRLDEREGRSVIIDYKSSAVQDQKKADKEAGISLQLSIYALAYDASNGRPPDEVQLHFLDSGLIGRATRDHDALEKTRETVLAVGDGIRAANFEPTPTYLACQYCAYRQVCPYTAKS